MVSLNRLGVVAYVPPTEPSDQLVRALEAEPRFRTIFERAPIGVARVLLDGTIVEANASLARFLARPAAELIGRNIAELTHPDDRALGADDLARMCRGEIDGYAMEKRYLRPDGTAVWAQVSVSLVRDADGRPLDTIGAVVDIDHRRRIEAALHESQTRLHQTQRIEAVGRLAGGIAHDYNNLLTAISSYADVVLQEIGPESAVAADVREISDAASRAAALTRQLLAFTRQQVMRREPLDVAAVVSELRPMLASAVGADIVLHTRACDTPAVVRADRAQLEQVLINLALNARDAMPRGGTLTVGVDRGALDAAFVAAHPGSREGRYVALSVRDSGAGMSPDVVARAFEPFFTTKPLGVGTGLGLSTVYGIVKQLDGYIELASEVDAGTTATIWLPALATPVRQAGAGVARAPASGNETILLVEDEPAVRAVATRVLRRSGYHVLEAPDGERAVEVARAHASEIHLVLTDVVMPRLSGRELVDRLREQGIAPLVLFMSGYAEDAVVRLGDFPAGTSFLEKPFTVQTLLDSVRAALDATRAA